MQNNKSVTIGRGFDGRSTFVPNVKTPPGVVPQAGSH